MFGQSKDPYWTKLSTEDLKEELTWYRSALSEVRRRLRERDWYDKFGNQITSVGEEEEFLREYRNCVKGAQRELKRRN